MVKLTLNNRRRTKMSLVVGFDDGCKGDRFCLDEDKERYVLNWLFLFLIYELNKWDCID